MGDIALFACCMDWRVFLYVERCQVVRKGNTSLNAFYQESMKHSLGENIKS